MHWPVVGVSRRQENKHLSLSRGAAQLCFCGPADSKEAPESVSEPQLSKGWPGSCQLVDSDGQIIDPREVPKGRLRIVLDGNSRLASSMAMGWEDYEALVPT